VKLRMCSRRYSITFATPYYYLARRPVTGGVRGGEPDVRGFARPTMPMLPKADLWRSGRGYRRGGGLAGRQPQAIQQVLHVLRAGEHRVFAAEQLAMKSGAKPSSTARSCAAFRRSPARAQQAIMIERRIGAAGCDWIASPAQRTASSYFLAAIACHRERELSGADGPRVARAQAESQQAMLFGLLTETCFRLRKGQVGHRIGGIGIDLDAVTRTRLPALRMLPSTT
jgi:hypothetical protein